MMLSFLNHHPHLNVSSVELVRVSAVDDDSFLNLVVKLSLENAGQGLARDGLQVLVLSAQRGQHICLQEEN